MSCIALIGGVIGCGKTTLINYLHENQQNLKVNNYAETAETNKLFIRIILDELCTIEEQAKMMNSLKGWRCFRVDLLMAAEHLICSLIHSKFVMHGPLTERSSHLLKKLKEVNGFGDRGRKDHFVFLSEDNFYYRSMRYDWFQLSRRANIGFCEVFLECPLHIAICRNRDRGYSIPEEKIRMMSRFMEYPEPAKYKWEKFSTNFNSSETLDKETVKPIISIIEEAAKSPAEILIMSDKIEAQSICSKNVVHQADKILRKLVSVTVSSKRGCCRENDLPSFTSLVVRVRHKVLSLIKEGEIEFSKTLLENLKLHGVESVQNEFEEAVRERFEEAINRTLFKNNSLCPSVEEESRILLSLKALSFDNSISV